MGRVKEEEHFSSIANEAQTVLLLKRKNAFARLEEEMSRIITSARSNLQPFEEKVKSAISVVDIEAGKLGLR